MAPIRYSLHYEDYSEHLMSRFGKLLQMQSLVDMTLMCSSHTLRVHKAVLAASSAYFQEVLQKQNGEPLIILKMRFSVLKSLVEFMYCGKTQCLEENLDELVSAAQFLKIKGLSKVTKEGLGINNHSELPVFTPPVVINRPPQSLIDMHTQDSNDPKHLTTPNTGQPVDNMGRPSKDMVVRIPFDIENGSNAPGGMDYGDAPRSIKPRRGRPSVRRTGGWESSGPLGRAAERALLRREQDSRKAIHQLKHLQTRHMQDYMDRVTLSQAVNSICGPESTSAHNYMGVDNDLMYMDQTVSSNVLDPTISYPEEHPMRSEGISSYVNTTTTRSASDSNSNISNAMSQYVDALKSAGLPTDLPILFESGDGSYINVNEQVLLDMVQSSEIQYEVIEQPNIIEKVADPSEIKSIDDLSKSIERGELISGNKSYSGAEFDKDAVQFSNHEDSINSLNAILPDNLDSFGDQQNYVVLDQRMQNNHSMDHDPSHDFSGIEGDMHFFTKSMSDDVKKYYQEQHLNEARTMEQLCPTSTALDTSFTMSLLDTKNSHLDENMSQQFNLQEDLRRNEDCYDFSLQLPQASDFKDDGLDCLMSTPKQTLDNSSFDINSQLEKPCLGRDEIMNDLMNIEKNMGITSSNDCAVNEAERGETDHKADFDGDALNVSNAFSNETRDNEVAVENTRPPADITSRINSSGLQWEDNMDINAHETENNHVNNNDSKTNNNHEPECGYNDAVIDLTAPSASEWEDKNKIDMNKENEPSNESTIDSTLDDDIPYAVGLLPLKHVQPIEDSTLKRKSLDGDLSLNLDANCLKRKVKYKKLQ
ncbi:probable serine/threonine-protein kinase DDB_G0283337 [Cydia strobilella]|uniref:probable serine/threonine-protein kinase DDB_G0283337 n=1 Tax=Cydia strobilella TaxID=1100964 RepID=UPI0030041CB0